MVKSRGLIVFIISLMSISSMGQSVIINEFQKDPPPDGAEFIEILNTKVESVNLQGWQIGDERKLILISDTVLMLKPNSFLVITDDSAGFISQFGIRPILEKRSLPALNNSGDQIRLFDASGQLLDSLQYESDWGGKDVSLERRSSKSELSTYAENWAESPSTEGGTPGYENEVETDNSPPVLLESSFLGNSAIQLIYDELLKENYATDPALFNVSGAPTLLFVQQNLNQLSLYFEKPFRNDSRITISVPSQSDIFGNVTEPIEVDLHFIRISQAKPDSVIINEILFRRLNPDSPEFIEIYNISGQNYDLSNWSIRDASGNTAYLPDGLIIGAGEYLLFSDQESFSSLYQNGYFLNNFPNLNDNLESITLLNSYDNTIDSLFYSSDLIDTGKGISLEKIDPRRTAVDLSNWVMSNDPNGHTAGSLNSRFEIDTKGPELLFARSDETESKLTLEFSEFIDSDRPPVIYLGPDGDSFNSTSNSIDKNTITLLIPALSDYLFLEADSLFDEVGNLSTSLTLPIAFPPEKGDLVFTELMFDPIQDNYDGMPDQSEYVELFNRTNRSISMEGIRLRTPIDEDGDYSEFIPDNSRYKQIEAGKYFLIFADEKAQNLNESELGSFFSLGVSQNKYGAAIKRSTLSLSADKDAVILTDSLGLILDSLTYEHSWHNPNMFDHKGIALEKIRPNNNIHTDDEWSSSTHTLGGTPANINSISISVNESCIKGCFNQNTLDLEPNPFSPSDLDGFEDFLSINYTLDDTDYFVDIDIFDRYGRKVRSLVNNNPAGPNGSFIWDGFRDDGSPNRVGRYIILFKARNNKDAREITLKKTVVIARR